MDNEEELQSQQVEEPQNQPIEQVEEQSSTSSADNKQERLGGDVVEQIARVVDQRIKEFLKRQRQSTNDMVERRINQELKRLQDAGIQATPEQVEKLVAEPESQAPQQVSETANLPLDPVTKQAVEWLKEDGVDPNQADPFVIEIYKMQAAAGVHLVEDDIEVAELREKSKDKSLYETMRLVDEAIQAKKRRVEGSPARIPAMSKGDRINVPDMAKKPSLDIFEEYYQRR